MKKMTDKEIYDIWEKSGSLMRVDYDFPLASFKPGKWLAGVRYPDDSVKFLFYGNHHDSIDPLLRNICFDLCKAGYYTAASCQGRTRLDQFDMDVSDRRRHSDQAYISFYDNFSESIINRCKEVGINVYGDNDCISSKIERFGWKSDEYLHNHMVECFTKEEKHKLIAYNLSFDKRIRYAFQLSPPNIL